MVGRIAKQWFTDALRVRPLRVSDWLAKQFAYYCLFLRCLGSLSGFPILSSRTLVTTALRI